MLKNLSGPKDMIKTKSEWPKAKEKGPLFFIIGYPLYILLTEKK